MNSNLGPQFLYHGTTDESAEAIERDGLHPRSSRGGRNLTYLSSDVEDAKAWAKDRANEGKRPVLFHVDATDIPTEDKHWGEMHTTEAVIPPERLRRENLY